jgi:TatA/E family protein of Tat protein translocase
MFGSLGVPELLLIFAVILIVFGPRRIPEIGKTLGKALGEFRKATDDLKSTIEREVRMEELKAVAPTIRSSVESIARIDPIAIREPEPIAPVETALVDEPAVEPVVEPVEAPVEPATDPKPAESA